MRRRYNCSSFVAAVAGVPYKILRRKDTKLSKAEGWLALIDDDQTVGLGCSVDRRVTVRVKSRGPCPSDGVDGGASLKKEAVLRYRMIRHCCSDSGLKNPIRLDPLR